MPTVLHTAAVICSMVRPSQAGGGVLADARTSVEMADPDLPAPALAYPAAPPPASPAVNSVCARGDADAAAAGSGRQVLSLLGGVRRARRASAADPWPALDEDGPPGTPGDREAP